MYVNSTDAKSFQEVAKLVSPMTTVPITSSITPGTICSPFSAGIRPDNIRNYGEPIYRRTTT
ncbi:hypothetical protein M9458_021411, partial [Cirrhinus mrigala]